MSMVTAIKQISQSNGSSIGFPQRHQELSFLVIPNTNPPPPSPSPFLFLLPFFSATQKKQMHHLCEVDLKCSQLNFMFFFLRKIYFYMQNVMQYAKFNLTYNYPDHLWVCYIYILFIMQECIFCPIWGHLIIFTFYGNLFSDTC